MNVKKIFWALRAIVYKPFFGKIGNLSYIGKPLYISGKKKIKIENRVRIYPGARMEAIGDNGKITIRKNTSIGQNFHITSCDSELEIQANTTISGNVFITNIDHDYTVIDRHIMEQDYITRKTVIGENCFIGYGVGIQAGTVLGKQCIVGANSVVRGVFPDYCVIVGAPARIVKKYNIETKRWEKYNG